MGMMTRERNHRTKRKAEDTRRWFSPLTVCLALVCGGCTLDSARSRYLLAEKLWTEGKYEAAVTEFEKVTQRDPKGKLGMQALVRGASTQTLFLDEHIEAVEKFKAFTKISPDKDAGWSADKQIGEILFAKLKRYDEAINHYRALLNARRDSEDTPLFLYRIAESHFYLWEFEEAAERYREVAKRFPNHPLGVRSAYEIGVALYTSGEQTPGGDGPGMGAYREAIEAYRRFIKTYPDSEWVPEARFGIAACLEELDRLDEALNEYEKIGENYPSPKVIRIKITRLKQRMAQRHQ